MSDSEPIILSPLSVFQNLDLTLKNNRDLECRSDWN